MTSEIPVEYKDIISEINLGLGFDCFAVTGNDDKIHHYLEDVNVFDQNLHFLNASLSINEYIVKNAKSIEHRMAESLQQVELKEDSRIQRIMEVKSDSYGKYRERMSPHAYWELVTQQRQLLKMKSKGTSRLFGSGSTILQPHPINLDIVGKIYRREPIISSAIEERAFEIIQPGFDIECENKQARDILLDFTESSHVKFFEMMKNAVINYDVFGNNYLQPVVVDNEIVRLFNMDPRYMFVETDYQRNVFGYWEFSEYAQEYFFPYEIIHWKRNATVEEPYGFSVIHSLVETVKRKLNVWADAIKALHRYGSPIILWIFGNEKIPRMPKDKIINFISELKKHPSNDIGVPYGVDGKTLGSDFRVVLDYIPYLEEIRNEILGGVKVPPVALGLGKTEAQSRENLEAFDKRNQTGQRLLTNNLILPLFRLVLDLRGIGLRKVKKLNVRWNQFERIERSKKEQNVVKLQVSGTITPNEARKRIGMTQPIKAWDPIANKEIKNYGDMFIYPIQQQQNITTGSVGQTFNSNKVNPQTDKKKQPKGRVTKQ